VRASPPVTAALILLSALLVPALYAQPATVRVLDTRADGLRLEVTAAYPAPLATTLEASRVRMLDAAAVRVAVGDELTIYHPVALPALATPAVSVVSVETDEARLATGPAAALLTGPLVRAGAPGLARKVPTSSIAVRLLGYDPATQQLARVRRLVVDVRYGGGAPAGLAPSFSRGGAQPPNPHLSVTRSVLADGTWYRLAIPSEGVYRLDAAVVTAMGLAPGSLDPARLRIFGGSGVPLPAQTDAARVADLLEYPTFVRGGGDGRFDADDGVLFYARGPVSWKLSPFGEWEHTTHPFSTETFVFVKVDDAPAARRTPETVAFPNNGAADRTTVEGRHVAEFDQYMWSKENRGSGLTYVSTLFGPGTDRTLLSNGDLPGLAAGTIRYLANAAVRSVDVCPGASMRFSAGGQALTEAAFGCVTNDLESPQALERRVSFTQTHGGGAFTLTARLTGGAGERHEGAVDFVRAFYPQTLTATGGVLRFVTPRDTGGPYSFLLSGFTAAPEVWDVTDPLAVRRLSVQAAGGGYRVQLPAGAPRELVAFSDAGLRRLTSPRVARVPAQNLHAPSVYPDLAIVTSTALRAQAEALAAHRRGQGLRVEVAVTDAIYNEFSGGIPDMRAVRDYFKFLYDRAPTDAQRIRYGLLFGDGHFNYRRIGPDSTLANHVFPYETDNTLDALQSYTTDDYFALLDDGEGIWGFAERADIAVGRLPVQTVAEAGMLVGKLTRYDDPATYGPWRTRYLFSADDGYYTSSHVLRDYDLHVQNADLIAEYVNRTAPRFDIPKVYALSYEPVFTTGWRIPAVNRAIRDEIENGLLVFNYFGHGSPEVLADERIFTKAEAEHLTNGDRLPIFITATCSFGRWDMDDEQSAAEALMLNAKGGAIAAFTTVRLVFTSPSEFDNNPGVNRRLTEGLLAPGPDGRPVRVGDALYRMKQFAVGYDDGSGRKFNLLGDPSMRFGAAPLSVTLDRVAGVDLAAMPDTVAGAPSAPLRALDRVPIEGTVRNPDGSVAAGFSGRVTLSVYDAERQVPLPYNQYLPTPYYRVRDDLLWRGEVPVTNGRFSASFVVPRDISYANRRGRIVAYATGGATHAHGATQRVVVGGTNPNPVVDNAGPRLRVFVGDTTFVSGGFVARGSDLLVTLDDETGINTVGAGVGHELLLVVNGDESRAINLGNRFEADARAPNRGTVRYRLSDLPVGVNRLKVRAWDVVGNVSEAEVTFTVAEPENLALQHVLAFPNPTTGPVRFSFEHNQVAGTAARVRLQVFTLDGRLVRVLDGPETLPAGALTTGRVEVRWDGRDADGDRLAPGVYLFRVRVEREGVADGPARQVAEHIERLVVLR
jgi:hypothetical protein